MTKASANANPLNQVANTTAIQLAEAQYRLARYFTPYNFDPERIDYDRVGGFMDDVKRAFPGASPNLLPRLDDLQSQINQHRQTLVALTNAGAEATLTDEQLFATAKANVVNPSMAGYSRTAA